MKYIYFDNPPLLCRVINETPSKTTFHVINGAWDGIFENNTIIIKEIGMKFPNEISWSSDKLPNGLSSYDYNQCITEIKKMIGKEK